MKKLTTDYKTFASDGEEGLLPYLAACIKKLIREGDDVGLQTLVNDIAYIADELYDMNENIPNEYEKFAALKAQRDAIIKANEERRKAIERLEAQMEKEFGGKLEALEEELGITEDMIKDEPEPEENVEDALDALDDDALFNMPDFAFGDEVDQIADANRAERLANSEDQKDALSIDADLGKDEEKPEDIDNDKIRMIPTISEIDDYQEIDEEKVAAVAKQHIDEMYKQAEEEAKNKEVKVVGINIEDDDILSAMFNDDDDDFMEDISEMDFFPVEEEDLSALPIGGYEDEEQEDEYENAEETYEDVEVSSDGILGSDFF